jgi:serine/threonine-protein kinase
MTGPVSPGARVPSAPSPLFPPAPPDNEIVARLRAALEGRYVLQREIGSGGMATVYSAEDIRHARQVAIKLLRPELSAILGGERFLNEIRVTAHLQHPHILPLLDSGDAGGLLYYIMPYVEGESLRARISRERQLPIADAVRIARDVADALDYAHRHGVIHRDVKPENILLHEGRPMVADFGIALAVRNAGGPRLTETGLSVGTPSYMSPEQATGEREVDSRSDIYSLGCVLYEMLVGEPPHTAPTVQALMTRVVTEKPRPVVEVRETVPDHVADAVHTALAKLPADRFATAGLFADALQSGTASFGGVASGVRRSRAASRRRWMSTALLAGGAIAAGAAGAVLLRGGRAPIVPPTRLSVIVESGARGAGIGLARQLAITPDGEKLVYLVRENTGTLAIALHRLDSETHTILAKLGVTGGGDATNALPPASNDRLAYSTPEGLMQVPASGGAPFPIGVPLTQFMAWESDSVLWYQHPTTRGLHRRAGAADSVILPYDSTGNARIQQVLPGGRNALMLRVPFGTRTGTLYMFDVRSRALRPVMETPVVEARYTTGLLVYATLDGALYAIRFDARRGRTSGRPVQLATNVTLAANGVAQFAVSDNGTVVWVPSQPAELVLVDRSGGARPALAARQNFHSPQFSPDGRHIAMDFTGPDGRDIWVLDLDQRTQTRVTFDRDAHDPMWSVDGRFIYYITRKSGAMGIYRARVGSQGPADSIWAAPELQWTGQPLPNGDLIATVVRQSGSDIVRIANGGRSVVPVVATPFEEGWPAVSPDGRWLAFASTQSGTQQVYVRRLDGEGGITPVSVNGGSEPVWSSSGRELFYRRPDAAEVDVMAASVETSPVFRVLGRSALFSAGAFDAAQPHANFDVSPNGRSFVAVRRDAATRIAILQNLPELVRRAGR